MRRSPRRRSNNQPDASNEPRINDRIRVPRVLVIDESGNKLGEFLTPDAVQLAQDRGLDLIEVAPEGRPPVCRIQDFGKLKYERKKQAATARKNQVHVQVKEVKLRPKTDEHDIAVKVRHSRRFLLDGNKVKVTIRFRGREHAHRNIGTQQCLRIAQECEDLGTIESPPRMDGRQMFMIMAPLKQRVVRDRDDNRDAGGDLDQDGPTSGKDGPGEDASEEVDA